MQFEMNHKVGTDYSTVTFKTFGHNNITNSLQRIGGKQQENIFSWEFPSFITAQVIKEVIRNTCFVCGGLMKDGVAFDNTWVSSDDFGNDAGQRGTTMSKIGSAKQIKVRKCTSCGHSHT